MIRAFQDKRSVRWVFPFLLALGLGDRIQLLLGLAFRYMGDDDGVIWSGAVDYAHLLFREPYFYGQDYCPMFEALMSAPFIALGLPVSRVVPIVTAILAMAPFWSFGLYHWRRSRHAEASLFAALPLLLPIEHGMMTTITRGLITGISVFALLPWIGEGRKPWKSIGTGAVLAAAWLVNPNALVFGVPFAIWYVLREGEPVRTGAWVLLGSLPFLLCEHLAQSYCQAHPDRMTLVLHDWKMDFHPEGIWPRFALLNEHFRWLFPIIWNVGALAFFSLAVMAVLALLSSKKALAAGLLGAMVLITASFGFAKTHDGFDNPFFPLSRMFLAMPLLLAWAAVGLVTDTMRRWLPLFLGGAALVMCFVRGHQLEPRLGHYLKNQPGCISVTAVDSLHADALALRTLCEEHDVGMILCIDRPAKYIRPFRCYLYPVLEPDLPPTYSFGRERRYWQREALADSTIGTVLVIGGDLPAWRTAIERGANVRLIEDKVAGSMVLVQNNHLASDSLGRWAERLVDGGR